MERIKQGATTFDNQIRMLQMRSWGSVLIILSLIASNVYFASRSNFVALDPVGNVYNAQRAERTDRNILLIEADAHARSFYATFWTMNHNNIKEQMRKADDLGGEIISKAYKTLQENGFYNEIIKNGYYVNATIDSIGENNFHFSGNKVSLRVYGHMTLENSHFSELRDLDMDLSMDLVDRIREKNPNGLSIENINIISNETISVNEKE